MGAKGRTAIKKRNYGLDYLRIFAMLATVWVHISIYVGIPIDLKHYFGWGAYGVQIFFVLSGYLAIKTYNGNMIDYYKKRALRILPSYYIGIILMIFIRKLFGGVTNDIFGLKWIRYFLGLNTILPSNGYGIWNNLYGYWTMSCFIWFYIMVPLIAKIVKNFKKAIIFYFVCFGIFIVWKIGMTMAFSLLTEIDRLDDCIGAAPFSMLYYFALGIIAYYAVQERKHNIAIGFFLMVAVLGLIINRNAWVWGALTGMAILIFDCIELKSKNELWNRIISAISNYSLYIYLVHLMSFDISRHVVNSINNISIYIQYILWGVISIFCIGIIVFIMNMTDKIVQRAIG